MKNIRLAFDIGNSQVKIAEDSGRGIALHTIPTPENLVRDGVVQTPHLLTDFLRDIKKEYKLSKGPCALVVPDALAICRTITLPAMTEGQLALNLPFEFSDYISEDPQKYVYDYALQQMILDEEGKPREMVLMGAAMSKEWSAQYVEIFKDAGFKLKVLIPKEKALSSLIGEAMAAGKLQPGKEYCLISLDHSATEIYIFRGGQFSVVRSITMGGADIDAAIAEHENVEPFVARTYKNTNYNKVLEQDYVRDVFSRISVEVMKVINFYRFNNRESDLDCVYFAGGGSSIPGLCASIAETNGFAIRPLDELLPDGIDQRANAAGLSAIGALMQ